MSLMTNTKQLPEESARMFLGRLKTNFGYKGYTVANSEEMIQEYFINGLLPSVHDKLESLYPIGLESALQLATKIEMKNSTVKDTRKQQKTTIPTLNNLETDTNSIKSLLDKMNAMKSELKVGLTNLDGRMTGIDGRINAAVDTRGFPPNQIETQDKG